MSQRKKVVSFLKANGWTGGDPGNGQHIETFIKKDSGLVISIYDGQMVFTDKAKNHIEKKLDYHALLGVLVDTRQLPVDYKRV